MKGLPKLVITDIDGVWTDGGMYYDESGNEYKKFNTSDSAGVVFCHLNDILVAIITGEETRAVERRSAKLKIDYLFQGVRAKLQVANTLCQELEITLSEVAFIGDDLNDIPLIREVGLSATTHNAPDYIKELVDIVTIKSGGSGAFREFIEYLLKEQDLLDTTISRFINSIK